MQQFIVWLLVALAAAYTAWALMPAGGRRWLLRALHLDARRAATGGCGNCHACAACDDPPREAGQRSR